MLRVAVIGAGHLGRHHARIYAAHDGAQLVGVADTDPAKREIADQYGVPFFSDYYDLIGKVDAVSLAVPTIDHCVIGCELMRNGIHVLVEKPISRSLEEADQLLSAANENNVTLAVGHVERHNPALQAVFKILTQPLFFEMHRLGVFTMRSLDIDVVMDLMIHDLDILLALTGSEVSAVSAVGIAILSKKIDIANARVEFVNGAVANITASRISSEKVRKLRFFQPYDYISVDYASQWAGAWSLKPPSPTSGAKPEIGARYLEVVQREPLEAEISDFLRAVETRTSPLVDGAQGRKALELATEILKKIEEHSLKAGVPTTWSVMPDLSKFGM
ncbi:MAG TPA: Gfo/Idh/MocA family oxidoreductase [Blastocatellia bacterium]|nr:Gfo/Idh/MocA family oxidoreductase [Blastocatellia bacterium]